MLVLPIALVLAAAPQARVSIVERSTLQLTAAAGAELRAQLASALTEARLAPELARDKCPDRACLFARARDSGAAVIGVTLVKDRRGVTVDLEAVNAVTVLQQRTLAVPAGRLDQSADVQLFAHQLAALLLLDRPVAEAEKPGLVPRDVPDAPLVVAAGPSPAPKVIGGVSAGLGAVGLGLLVAGLVVKGGLDAALAEQPVVTSLTRAQAEQQASLANGLMVSGAVALGLGVAGAATAMGLRFAEAEAPLR